MTAPQPPEPADPNRATGQASVPVQNGPPSGPPGPPSGPPSPSVSGPPASGPPAPGPSVTGPPPSGAPVFGMPGGPPAPGQGYPARPTGAPPGVVDAPPPGPTPSRKRSWAVPIALLALLASLGSAVVSWRALDQAGDARDIANARTGGAGVVPSVAPPAPTGGPAPDPTGSAPLPTGTDVPPSINATVDWAVKYADTEIQSLATCSSTRYLDVDAPRVDVGTDYDLAHRGACGSADGISLQAGEGVKVAQAATAVTQQECWQKLDLSPVAADQEIAVKQGLFLCVKTADAAAKARGDRPQLVLLEVLSVASTGTVTMKLKAWVIPA